MVYLDTGCLVKLYYPERESAAVTAAVVGEQIAFTSLRELEIVTAMQLKVFRGEAKPEQVVAAMDAVRADIGAGKLVESPTDWRSAFREAARLAESHAAAAGCRALDTLHCALAKGVNPSMFLSSDGRQIKLDRQSNRIGFSRGLHVHVQREARTAKFWLEPIECERSSGFSRSDLMDIYRLIEQHQKLLLQKWH